MKIKGPQAPPALGETRDELIGPVVEPLRKWVPQKVALPAETGRPEISAEFAKCIKHSFVLKGPRERMEGGNRDVNPAVPVVSLPMVDEGVLNKKAYVDKGAQSNETSTDDSVEAVGEQGEIPLSFLDEDDTLARVKDHYKGDPFFKMILDSLKTYHNFEQRDGYIVLKSQDRSVICIPDVMVDGRKAREHLIVQVHSVLAHLGAVKTLAYLRDHFWWKSIVSDVQKYCKPCQTCKQSKPPNQKPHGLLNPLSIPSKPWEEIGINFIGPLPLLKNKDDEFDLITVVIDLLMAMVHLVPNCITYTAREVAELVFVEVHKYHGLPKSIVSNRDVLFTSIFWTHLQKLIGVDQRMSSAFHPQSDGSTERVN